MAAKKTKVSEVKRFLTKPKKNRKGIHSKKKNSKLKQSKNYVKRYRGQGK